MIGILLFIFTFYAFTALLAFLGYILWYILCTNATLSFVVSHQKRELLTFHIKSIDPDYRLHGGYESASHPVDNTWHTAPQSPTRRRSRTRRLDVERNQHHAGAMDGDD